VALLFTSGHSLALSSPAVPARRTTDRPFVRLHGAKQKTRSTQR